MNTSHSASETEQALLKASIAIGGIAEMAQWASADLALMMDRYGQPIEDLTVGELMELLQLFDQAVSNGCTHVLTGCKAPGTGHAEKKESADCAPTQPAEIPTEETTGHPTKSTRLADRAVHQSTDSL